MHPRIITRTHYQVDEPAYLSTLILECSSATKSDYTERLAQRLEEALKKRGREFNLAAAKYCVDLARAVNLLTENNFWTANAQILALIRSSAGPEFSTDLTLSERIFWLRTFLEHDGAAIVFFANEIVKDGKIPASNKDWNSVANEMMTHVYESYLNIIQDFQDRARVRQLLEKRRKQPYSGKSGTHQCFVHLNVMARIELIESMGRDYFVGSKAYQAQLITRFLKLFPTIEILEKRSATKDWFTILDDLFSEVDAKAESSDEALLLSAYEFHEQVMKTGASLCAISTIVEAIQIQQIASGVRATSFDNFMRLFRTHQAKNPKKVRFHVDRIGRPAFISLS